MHLTLPLTTLLATTATALSVPAPHWRFPQPPSHGLQNEHIAVSSYSLRKINSTIQSVSFHISAAHGQNVTCSTGAIPLLPSSIVPCAGEAADAGFRFSLSQLGDSSSVNATAPAAAKDPNQYALTIYHGNGREGKWGRVAVPTYCHAGGMGPSDFACVQVPVGSQFGVTLRG